MPIFYIDSGSFNNLQVTGSLLVTGEIFGTSSLATTSSHALTASFAPNYVLTSATSSFIQNNQTSSFYTGSFTGSFTGSLQGTSSWATNAISSSRPIAVTGSTIYSTAPLSTATPSTDNNIFLGDGAGNNASGSSYSNFIGYNAGLNATNAGGSNFLGRGAGYGATNANDSNFLGYNAGLDATDANISNFLGYRAGYAATNAFGSNFLGYSAGDGATNAYESNFIGPSAGASATNANDSNFIGLSAGASATNANNSNFLGLYVGTGATNANNSNFLGFYAGNAATDAYESNFIGLSAGYEALNANNSNFLGSSVGVSATNANNSNFLGKNAGFNATNAGNSNFLGNNAGSDATEANTSNFLGPNAGNGAVSASYSTLIGYQAGYTPTAGTSVKSNNIIIGTNITLPTNTQDSINLGAIIFATGSYSTLAGNPFSGSMSNGRVGINKVTPSYTLDVSGSGNYSNGLNVTGSLRTSGSIEATVGLGVENYKSPNRWALLSTTGCPSVTGQSLTSGSANSITTILVPFITNKTITVSSMSFESTTTPSPSTASVGIYAADQVTCRPTTLITSMSNIPIPSNSVYSGSLTTGPVTLSPGLYYTAFQHSGSATITFRSIPTANTMNIIGLTTPGNSTVPNYYAGVRAGGPASLPASTSSFSTMNPLGGLNPPCIWMLIS
jgi:hypothetical protein